VALGLTATTRGLRRLHRTHGVTYSVSGGAPFVGTRLEREVKDAMGDPVFETVLEANRLQFRTLPPQGAVIFGPDGEAFRLTGIRPGPVHHVHLIVVSEPR